MLENKSCLGRQTQAAFLRSFKTFNGLKVYQCLTSEMNTTEGKSRDRIEKILQILPINPIMYLFGPNPTICAKFQHLRELGINITVARCATAGPFIKLLRLYWTLARENSDIYRTFNRVLPPRRPFIKEFTSTPLSRKELDADFMTQQSLAGGDHKSLCRCRRRRRVLITLWDGPSSMSPAVLT